MTYATDIEALEEKRLALQSTLDGDKTSEDRNRMGQFATPTALAREILAHGIRLLPKSESIRFLDLGIGTGSFYSALRAVAPKERIERAEGFEIDPHYGTPARLFGKTHRLISTCKILPRLSRKSRGLTFSSATRHMSGITTSTVSKRPRCNAEQKRRAG